MTDKFKDKKNPLLIVTPGASISYKNARLCVEYLHNKKSLLPPNDFPIRAISSLVLYGPSNFTPYTMEKILQLNIPCHFFSQSGRFIARLCSPNDIFTPEIISINSLYLDQEKRAQIAAAIVSQKLSSIIDLNNQIIKNLDSIGKFIEVTQIKRHQESLRDGIAQLSKPKLTLDFIRGIEGSRTREHYSIISLAIKRNQLYFNIRERSRRPPKNAMNSLLSFFYSLLLGEVLATLYSLRLPICVGALHSSTNKPKPALALDFMEQFRVSIAEKLALRIVNLGQITPEHFEGRDGGVYLNREGRKVVTSEWLRTLLGESSQKLSPRERILIAAKEFKSLLLNQI